MWMNLTINRMLFFLIFNPSLTRHGNHSLWNVNSSTRFFSSSFFVFLLKRVSHILSFSKIAAYSMGSSVMPEPFVNDTVLNSWRSYLDHEETNQKDKERLFALHERCLLTCVSFPFSFIRSFIRSFKEHIEWCNEMI